MLDEKGVEHLKSVGRTVEIAETGDKDLGPLKNLPGTWKNLPNLPGHGWNSIALPFAAGPESPFNYRLLVNQYNEELKFSLVDKAVPNRGLGGNGGPTKSDQFVVTLDYDQMVVQISADDFPVSGQAGGPDLAIHREPGLWLHMANETTNGLDIARLSTIPHGDSVLALGTSAELDGAPSIPAINGLPVGGPRDLASPYLAPYKHFNDNPFKGTVTDPSFPGFNPVAPHELLVAANTGVDIAKTTRLEVDTAIASGGIANIPFIVKQANAAAMKSFFWIQELEETKGYGNPKLRLQYLQIVLLDFFPRIDGLPGLIRWPHVSINTLEKVAGPDATKTPLPDVA